jgi:phage-related protein
MENFPYFGMSSKSGSTGVTRPRPPGRPLIWVGSSKEDISALSDEVKASFGHRLRELQDGKTPLGMKPLPQFGTGVYELLEDFDRNTYRLMYVVNLKKGIYVLHVFIKKSKSGIGLPKRDANLIERRLQYARIMDAEE